MQLKPTAPSGLVKEWVLSEMWDVSVSIQQRTLAPMAMQGQSLQMMNK